MATHPHKANAGRTTVHATTDKAIGGTPAPIRDCTHFNCRGNGWHAVDCVNVGLASPSRWPAQKPEARQARRVHGKAMRED